MVRTLLVPTTQQKSKLTKPSPKQQAAEKLQKTAPFTIANREVANRKTQNISKIYPTINNHPLHPETDL